jgi:GNAT superfamily N-acetyltransferase
VRRSVRKAVRPYVRAGVWGTAEAGFVADAGRGGPRRAGKAVEARGHVRRSAERPQRRRHGSGAHLSADVQPRARCSPTQRSKYGRPPQ